MRRGFPDGPLELLCLGAHSDDLEIGAAGTVLTLLEGHPGTIVRWVVFSAAGERGGEARASATELLREASSANIAIHEVRDSFFPYRGEPLKELFEELKRYSAPDLILTHAGDDRHQDHRTVSELTWNTWRDQLILEYEIPKYDADLRAPNVFVALRDEVVARKLDHLERHFASQQQRTWYDNDTFRGLMRLRGMECQSPTRFAEGFYARKLIVR